MYLPTSLSVYAWSYRCACLHVYLSMPEAIHVLACLYICLCMKLFMCLPVCIFVYAWNYLCACLPAYVSMREAIHVFAYLHMCPYVREAIHVLAYLYIFSMPETTDVFAYPHHEICLKLFMWLPACVHVFAYAWNLSFACVSLCLSMPEAIYVLACILFYAWNYSCPRLPAYFSMSEDIHVLNRMHMCLCLKLFMCLCAWICVHAWSWPCAYLSVYYLRVKQLAYLPGVEWQISTTSSTFSYKATYRLYLCIILPDCMPCLYPSRCLPSYFQSFLVARVN